MIGPHVNGVGGSRQGLGEYISRTAAAGLRPTVCCPNDEALAVEVADAGGTAIFRKTSWSFEPRYDSGDPFADATDRWNFVETDMPAGIRARKGLIWLEVLTEPRKEAADYVHRFMVEFARLANAAGYKVAGPSWSTGTPEVDAWETGAGLAWLRYCADHGDQAALSLHEYSLDAGDIKDLYPYLIGRFEFILEICAAHGIEEPPILFSEVGWTYDDMPAADEAMADLAWLAEVYGERDVLLWTLGQWPEGPDLPPKLAAIMPDLTEFVLQAYQPDEEEEPPMSETLAEHLWRVSIEEQTANGIHVNPDTAINRAIYGEETPGLVPVTNERRTTHEEARYAYQVAQNPTDSAQRRVYFVAVPEPGQPWGSVKFITGPEGEGHQGLAAPIGTAEERASGKIWPGAWVDANPYGNWYQLRGGWAYHTGADLNLNAPHWNADKGRQVYAVASGQVTYAGRWNENWGNLVIVRHEAQPHAPEGFYCRYAHLGRIDVQKGQVVQLGQPLGTVGGADVGLPDHLHFDVSLTEILAGNPGDWPGSSLARLRRDYVDPKAFLEGKVDGGVEEPPPPVDRHDLLPYMRTESRRLFELRRQDGSQERVQCHVDGARWFYVKGTGGLQGRSEWEELIASEDWIYRGIDTSPGGGRYYELRDSLGEAWSRWCPRRMAIGERFTRNPWVLWHRKSDCARIAEPAQQLTRIRLAAIYERWTSPANTSIILDDVAVMEVTHADGRLFERTYMAKNYGLVGFEGETVQSYISEIHAPGARPDNVREEIGCL